MNKCFPSARETGDALHLERLRDERRPEQLMAGFPFLVSRVGYKRPQLKRGGELNRFVQRPVQGTPHSVNAVRTLDYFLCRFRRHQLHGNVNAPNDQYTLLCFHLSGYIRGQFSVAGIDLARFQRASKGANHSASGRRNHIVNG